MGFRLSAKYILHTVVPKWKNGKHQEYELLSTAYLSALRLGDEMGCESMAFPLLASGNNGFDLEIAYNIAKESIESYEMRNRLSKVYLVIYGREVVSMLRNMGIVVEEMIDEIYVLEKKEEYKLPFQKSIDDGKEIVQGFIDEGMKMAVEYLKNPNNRKELLQTGAKIANVVIAIKKKKR